MSRYAFAFKNNKNINNTFYNVNKKETTKFTRTTLYTPEKHQRNSEHQGQSQLQEWGMYTYFTNDYSHY